MEKIWQLIQHILHERYTRSNRRVTTQAISGAIKHGAGIWSVEAPSAPCVLVCVSDDETRPQKTSACECVRTRLAH